MRIIHRYWAVLRQRLDKESIPPFDCMHVPQRITELPDPSIYSQFYLKNLSLPFTWDNPDIRIFKNGVEAYTYDLLANTEYRVEITIHNNSTIKSASKTVVRVVFIEFGIGGGIAVHHFLSEKKVDIAARGQSGEPAKIATSWRTPVQPDHYCLEVTLSHPLDGNNGNNRGWNNTVVKDAAPGETITLNIPVWNAFPREGYKNRELYYEASKIQLTMDSYQLELPLEGKLVDMEALFEPKPVAWGAKLDQSELNLPPGQGPENIKLSVTVPQNVAAGKRQVFNISGSAIGRLIGGVTLITNVKEI
jgi:hypothetical protein